MVLRPGVALPLVGYLGMSAIMVAMVILVIVAPMAFQKGHPQLTKNDWGHFPMRVATGEMLAIYAWFFYKLASNKIILRAGNADILTWGMRWRVGRDEVADVTLGLFKNAMSAQDIQRKILEWRRAPCASQAPRVGGQSGGGRRYWPCRTHWTIRANGWLLVILTVIVLLESTIVTLFAGTS